MVGPLPDVVVGVETAADADCIGGPKPKLTESLLTLDSTDAE